MIDLLNIKITGTGSYIPGQIQKNSDFLNHSFLTNDGLPFDVENAEIIEKFSSITGIKERRYANKNQNSSDLAANAATKAIADSKIDQETLDYIIVAHNFGDTPFGSKQSNSLPSVASKVKAALGIKNPKCVAYDILFGCPGWIEGVIQAKAFIKSGMAKKCLVIGTETLSRVVDKYDRDSMIYSDGAAACVIEKTDKNDGGRILSSAAQSHTFEETYFLFYGQSYNPDLPQEINYIKMHGRKIYEFALSNVPLAMKSALDKSAVSIDKIKKVLIHQANEKMDEAIIHRFYKLYQMPVPDGIMPMSIHKLGNSSVATVPTLLDLVIKGKLEGHEILKGDFILLASVGAGMNINAIVYQY